MESNLKKNIPTLLQITIFFDQKGFELKDAEAFYNEYCSREWKGGRGVIVKNWRAKALDWMWRLQKKRPYLRSKAKLMI